MGKLMYDWERYWYPRGDAPALGGDGFLSDPTTTFGAIQNASLRKFEAFSQSPCLVMLGEPGIGKSRVLETERAVVEAEARANGEEVMFVDLRSVGSDSYLLNRVFGCSQFQSWAGACGEKPQRLHLFLDSMDECLLRVTTLAQILLDEFPRYPIERLSLRIACRTAVWNGSLSFLEDGLQKVWGKSNVQIIELAPLRRTDVLLAAEQNGVADPDIFVQAVRNVGAQAFAIKPVTLNLLLHIYKDKGALPNSLSEIYHRGCRLLCEESNESRKASRATGALSADQRFAVAARVAAVTVFANRYAVFTKPDEGDVPSSDVDLSSIVSGVERDPFGTPFPVTESALREALDTGLFTGHGPNRISWAHQTYAEYLAAWYVTVLHSMPGTRLLIEILEKS